MITKKELEAFADFQDGDDVWIFIRRMSANGSVELMRKSSGIRAVELLGLANLATTEIVQQIKGEITPDIIKRECLDKGEEKDGK